MPFRFAERHQRRLSRLIKLAKQAIDHAKRGASVHALRVLVWGGAPTPRKNAAKRQTYCCNSNKDIRRRRQKSRAACCPDRGKLSACQKVSERERIYSFCFCKKNQKAAGVSPCDPGSNRRSIHYFGLKFWFSSGNRLCTNPILHSIDGNDLNRCELQSLHKRICGFVRTRSRFF